MCGRSFEEAFFLANSENLERYSEGIILGELFGSLNKEDIILNAYNITQQSDFNSKKSGIALDILLMKERFIPQYIMEGLEWLSKN